MPDLDNTLTLTIVGSLIGMVMGGCIVLYVLSCAYAEDYICQRFDKIKPIHYCAMVCPIWNAYLAYLYLKSKDASIKAWLKRIYGEQFKWN